MATGKPEQFGYGLLGGLTYATSTATSVMQQSLAENAMNATYVKYNPYANMTSAFMLNYAVAEPQQAEPKPKTPRWKSAKRMIDRLRMEIEDWHGDVLDRRVFA